jgi:hypothetical protein
LMFDIAILHVSLGNRFSGVMQKRKCKYRAVEGHAIRRRSNAHERKRIMEPEKHEVPDVASSAHPTGETLPELLLPPEDEQTEPPPDKVDPTPATGLLDPRRPHPTDAYRHSESSANRIAVKTWRTPIPFSLVAQRNYLSHSLRDGNGNGNLPFTGRDVVHPDIARSTHSS